MTPLGLIILGFGGHARSVADVAFRAGIPKLIFVDDAAAPGESFAGFPAQSHWPGDCPDWLAFPASGDAARRKDLIAAAEQRGFETATLLSPAAHIGLDTAVGKGVLVAHGAHIGPGARIGTGAIVNSQAVVEHEVCVGEFSHVAVNATLAGRCVIGKRVMIGAGATVVPSVKLCDDVVVGAGAVVARDIVEPGTYVGVPARRVR